MTNHNEKEVYLTDEGLNDIKEELNSLKIIKRPEVIKAIKEARLLGDIKENAEYHSAREEQALLEARIQELETLIEDAIIIKPGKTNKVEIGVTIKIEYLSDQEIEEYKIVGSHEANPLLNKISNESPLAQAVMGHKKNDVVTVDSPNGSYNVKIISIQ